MILSFIEMAGFRGYKNKIRFDIPAGFLVVSGNNGSGKSTICDAFKFALTGTLQYPESTPKEKGENIEDYTWWRGSSEAKEKFVSLGFMDSEGKEHVITRDPDGIVDSSSISLSDLENILIDTNSKPSDGLGELYQTMVLRGDEIASKSFDLSELKRYEFVKSALGVHKSSIQEDLLLSLERERKEIAKDLENNYQLISREFTSVTTQLSEEFKEVVSQENISEAEKLVKDVQTKNKLSDVSPLEYVRKYIPNLRNKIDKLFYWEQKINENLERKKQAQTPEYQNKVKSLEKNIQKQKITLSQNELDLKSVNQEIKNLQIKEPKSSRLLELHSLGDRLGLKDGCCPLCGSIISEENYHEHLKLIKNQVQVETNRITDFLSKREAIEIQLNEIREIIEIEQQELNAMMTEVGIIESQLERIVEELINLGLSVKIVDVKTIKIIEDEIDILRKNLGSLERAGAILEASKSYDKMSGLKKIKGDIKKKQEFSGKQLDKIRSLKDLIVSTRHTLQRISGELVDERLAELAPIVNEMYGRLKPHIDWNVFSYYLRGDVQRSLIFQVGEELNPKYFFSSGQLRITGLAFLLAIFISRGWSHLNTLILDDPIQHIDDFRVIHLVELLSSLRKSNNQIICTVESSDLAELLCRRLRSNEFEAGEYVRVKYSKNNGCQISSRRKIDPLKKKVLKSA